MAQTFDKVYFRQKMQQSRLRKTYHLNQQMPFESNQEFKRRVTKRIVIVDDDSTIILDPFGNVLKIIK